MQHRPHSRQQGFTLVEVSVSTTLSLLLLLSLTMAVLNVGEQGRHLSDHLDRGARVRLMMDLLVSDLQSAIVKQDQNTWLAIDILDKTDNSGAWVNANGQKPSQDSLRLDPRRPPDSNGTAWADPEDYRFGVAGMWLRFISSAADRAVFTDGTVVPGDVNAISYQLIRREIPSGGYINDAANASYQLFRTIVRADHTFDTGYVVDAYQGGALQGDPGEMKSPSVDSMLCDNIIDFGIIIYEKNSSGGWVQSFPMRDDSLPPLKDKKHYRAPDDGVPATIEVMVRVLSASGARELRGLEQQGITPAQWWDIARRHSRVYSSTVALPRVL